MFTLMLLLVVLASMRGSFRAVCLPSGLDAYWYAYQETGDLQWFYMTFHRTDRAEYVRSGRKLCKETLKSLA